MRERRQRTSGRARRGSGASRGVRAAEAGHLWHGEEVRDGLSVGLSLKPGEKRQDDRSDHLRGCHLSDSDCQAVHDSL